ncbi:MAG: hypothetical protein V1827_00840 [Candidatus Micrarchaeota archaeon]
MAIFNPEGFRKEAKDIISRGRGARQAWFDLRQWASGKGPVAMKMGLHEFLSAYGGTPEAAPLLPDLLRTSSIFPPQERGAIIAMATHRQTISDMRIRSTLKPMTAFLKDRPISLLHPSSIKTQLRPANIAHPDIELRDIHASIHEQMRSSLRVLPEAREMPKMKGFDSSRSPDTLAIGMNKGEHIMSSLIDRMRTHGATHAPYLAARPKAAKRKRATTRKRITRAKTRKPAVRKGRKPARRKR